MERAGLEGGDGESTYDQNTELEILKVGRTLRERNRFRIQCTTNSIFDKRKKIKELTKHYITLIK